MYYIAVINVGHGWSTDETAFDTAKEALEYAKDSLEHMELKGQAGYAVYSDDGALLGSIRQSITN